MKLHFDLATDFMQIDSLSQSLVRPVAMTTVDYGWALFYTDKLDVVRREDIREAIEQNRIQFSDDEWVVWFEASPTGLGHDKGSLTFRQLDRKSNRLYLGGLLDFEFRNERYLINAYAQGLLRVTEQLYPIVKPRLGYIDETISCQNDFHNVDKLVLKKIAWVNFFSPAYIEKYGEQFFLELPAYRTERLADGGVFVQLTPSILVENRKDVSRVRNAVRDYCATHGYKVRCCSPYFIEQAYPVLTLDEIGEIYAFARNLAGTTFVLNDETRLKVIDVPWGQLPATHCQAVVAGMRPVLEHQFAEQSDAKWRIELNEMPDEFQKMLTTLIKKTKANVEVVLTE